MGKSLPYETHMWVHILHQPDMYLLFIYYLFINLAFDFCLFYYYLIQNSQAVKKECGPQKGYGEKRCEIQGGSQEMAVMVG